MSNNRKVAIHRLNKEIKSFKAAPPPYIDVEPDPNNIFDFHYLIHGPPDCPYHKGYYHGILRFPANYPMGPPSVLMYTPSGRFQVNKRICFSFSDFHPELWSPAWSVDSILSGLVSFMLDDELTTGGVRASEAERRKLAADSLDYNLGDSTFCELFPQAAFEMREQLARRENKSLDAVDAEAVEDANASAESSAESSDDDDDDAAATDAGPPVVPVPSRALEAEAEASVDNARRRIRKVRRKKK